VKAGFSPAGLPISISLDGSPLHSLRSKANRMSKVSVKGVLIGGIVDVSASFILGLVFALFAVAFLHAFGHVSHQVVLHSGALQWALLLVGLACSVLGGFVSAKIAKHDELLNGALSSSLCTALGVYVIAAGKGDQPLWVQILLLVASPAFGLVGGYLRLLQRPRSHELAG
jgi:putative membrane protein (TIGR04086 family)